MEKNKKVRMINQLLNNKIGEGDYISRLSNQIHNMTHQREHILIASSQLISPLFAINNLQEQKDAAESLEKIGFNYIKGFIDDLENKTWAKSEWTEGNYIIEAENKNYQTEYIVYFSHEPVAVTHKTIEKAIKELETMIAENNN